MNQNGWLELKPVIYTIGGIFLEFVDQDDFFAALNYLCNLCIGPLRDGQSDLEHCADNDIPQMQLRDKGKSAWLDSFSWYILVYIK